MAYDRQIIEILTRVGDKGISVQSLSKHVYNMNCNLFAVPDIVEIHRSVQQFLLRSSKSAQPLVERAGRRGFYRLNTANLPMARQLLFEFGERGAECVCEDEPQQPLVQDLSLDLFA